MNWRAAALTLFLPLAMATSLLAASPHDGRDLFSDTWVATDGLGRSLPTAADCRVRRSDRYVGIFYFLWHGFHGTGGPYDITRILAADPDHPVWDPEGAFHWWGEPDAGYFLATDPWVIRRDGRRHPPLQGRPHP